MKKIILTVVLALAIPFTAMADKVNLGEEEIDVSANVSITTDYVWRGRTQTDGQPAIQGGFDLSHGRSGVYFGNWNSNVDGGIEIDLYGGVKHDVLDSGYELDVGAIGYLYPGQDDLDFYEVYIGMSKTYADVVTPSIKGYFDPENEGQYLDLGVSFALPADITLNTHLGQNYPDGSGTETDWLVGASRPFFGLDLGLSVTGSDEDDTRVMFTASKSF